MATTNQTSNLWELPPMPAAPAKKPRRNNRKLLMTIIAAVAAVAVVLTGVVLALNLRATPTERVLRNYFTAIENRDAEAMLALSVFGAIPYADVAEPIREPFAQYMHEGALDMWGLVSNTSHQVREAVYFPANSVNLPAGFAAAAVEFAAEGIVAEEFAHMIVDYTIHGTANSYDGTGFFSFVRAGNRWYLMQDPYFFRGQ